jgi:hypothetical protein
MAHINLQKIVSVKGEAGLFHLVNYNPKGYFLQPFEGGPARFFANEKGRVLAIGNVDLKLKEGSINSLEIFHKIKEKSTLPANSTRDKIVIFFNEIISDLDNSVAPSQIEKIFRWYHTIDEHYHSHNLVNEEDDGLTIV